MHPDEEANLKAAFAELHRRQREQAPPFGAMRERALRKPDRLPTSERGLSVLWVRWAAIAACVAMAWVCWTGWRSSQQMKGTDSLQRLEQLITAIEEQVESQDAPAFPDYPTDLLLTSNSTESSL